MKQNFYSSGDVARQLNVPRYLLLQWLEAGKLPEPQLRVAGKRVFSEEELGLLKNKIENLKGVYNE